jgi:hypothetical protein
MQQKIYDNNLDCVCNKNRGYCTGHCRCYCHVPIWYRDIVWTIQELKYFGALFVVIFMLVFDPFVELYCYLRNKTNKKVRTK